MEGAHCCYPPYGPVTEPVPVRWPNQGIFVNRRAELTGIQFLRGFCALGVVVGHCAAMLAKPKYGGLVLLDGVLESGSLGVDIFFVISGFIMAVVGLQGRTLSPRTTMRAFFERRFIRIVPMMWLAILSYALLQKIFARDAIEIAPYARALLLLPFSYVKPDIIWTLRQELLFYLVFAIGFFGSGRWRALLVLWVFSPCLFLALRGDFWGTTAYIDNFWSILCSSVNLEFGMGLLLGIFWTRAPPLHSWPLPIHPFLLLALLLIAILGCSWSWGLVSQSLPSVVFIGLSGTLLVGLAARAHCPDGLLTALGRLLGDASYSIYLFHLHILAGLLAVRAKFDLLESAPLALAGSVIAATVASIMIHRLVERPLTRWLRARLGSNASVAPTKTRAAGGAPLS